MVTSGELRESFYWTAVKRQTGVYGEYWVLIETNPQGDERQTIPVAPIGEENRVLKALQLHEQYGKVVYPAEIIEPEDEREDYDVIIFEYGGNITAHIKGIRATAELSELGQSGVETFGLGPGNWLWFNRLINQSDIPHMGTVLLDKVLEYCKDKNYSIANQVSAYGDISQHDLEDWYIRKGFTPVDYGKYGNAFLKWVPE